MDAYVQQIGLGSSEKIQYCMCPLSEIVNSPKLQKQTKLRFWHSFIVYCTVLESGCTWEAAKGLPIFVNQAIQ